MMKYISMILIAYIVPASLSYLSVKAAESRNVRDDNFVIRPVGSIAKIGCVGAGFFLFCIIGSSRANQLDGFGVFVFGGLFLLSMLLVLATIKGFWDETVIGDKMTSSRLWIFKKAINIHDIDHCVIKSGGINIYVKGQKRKAMSIDGLSINTDVFLSRMEKEGVEVKTDDDSEE